MATFDLDLVLTPQQNVLVVDVPRDARSRVDAILAAAGVRPVESISPIERHALACPALPTCGLALAESERVLPGIADEEIIIRMTGCPNGCARPYMSEIGLVGVSADRYNLHLGGTTSSVRLNRVYRELVPGGEILSTLDPLLVAFSRERLHGESFGDFCERTVLPEAAVT